MFSINTTPYVVGFGVTLALAATVLTYIFILPEGKIKKSSKILDFVRDLFTFKNFYLEKALQALYIFTTLACITVGFMSLFGFSFSTYSFADSLKWAGGRGLLILFVGPIVTRLAYEAVMLLIKLVKNTTDINNKLQ